MLNSPINIPICLAGMSLAIRAYGIETILAHAIPTPVIGSKSKYWL